MPPMTSSMAEPGLLSARPRNTNFSIAAIMSENKETDETEADLEPEDSDEELEVGTEAGDDIAETSLETEEKVAPSVKKERKPKIMTGKSNCSDLDHIKCTLENKDLWDKFCEFGTEMIITRSGRRMFPTVRCSFANLDAEPGAKYLILLDIVPCDNKRYRYAYHRSSWLVAGKADPAPPHRLYCHPDAPFTAEQLRKQVISFEKVKVTNNESDNTGQVNISNITMILGTLVVPPSCLQQSISELFTQIHHFGNKIKTGQVSQVRIIIKILCQKFAVNERILTVSLLLC